MQKLHMHFIGAMGELGDLADEHAEKLELFLQKLGAKSFLAAMDPSETSELKTEDEYADALKLYLEKLSSEISALKLEMDTMSAKIRTQPSLALAVDLSNLGSRIAALSARHAKNIAFTEKQLRRLQAAESQLFASQSSAAKRGIDKHPELFALGQQAFKALRSTPRDLEAAEAKTAAYTTLLFELSEKGESNMD
jgi:predicted  nucleic acid-binding Zn-ribbon protein